MEITELNAYKRLEEMFEEKEYSLGKCDCMPIYEWRGNTENLTPGHYVNAINYGKIRFEDIPERYRTREFFLHTLSGAQRDIVKYVRQHPNKFDKAFFKDHIETDYYGLEFKQNDFEYMPLQFIDEEMVACAMFRAINMRYVERRGDCSDWFYSVYRRKPEVLTQDLYILGARCFAEKLNGKNKFLEITPEEYRTPEFYYAMCLRNTTPVMEDIPESVLTTDFLVSLINDDTSNIQAFSESALERTAEMKGRGSVKFWQATILRDGYQIKEIPLNEERIEFFLSIYDKDSMEYEWGFKEHYKRYLRQKNEISEPKNDAVESAAIMTIAGTLAGMDLDSATDLGTSVMKTSTSRDCMLPIHYEKRVPAKYSKKYDKEEYLLEIYKKIGIEVKQEADYDYYIVSLPENISVVEDSQGYCIKDSDGKSLVHYRDLGPFWDRTVAVDRIDISLE